MIPACNDIADSVLQSFDDFSLSFYIGYSAGAHGVTLSAAFKEKGITRIRAFPDELVLPTATLEKEAEDALIEEFVKWFDESGIAHLQARALYDEQTALMQKAERALRVQIPSRKVDISQILQPGYLDTILEHRRESRRKEAIANRVDAVGLRPLTFAQVEALRRGDSTTEEHDGALPELFAEVVAATQEPRTIDGSKDKLSEWDVVYHVSDHSFSGTLRTRVAGVVVPLPGRSRTKHVPVKEYRSPDQLAAAFAEDVKMAA